MPAGARHGESSTAATFLRGLVKVALYSTVGMAYRASLVGLPFVGSNKSIFIHRPPQATTTTPSLEVALLPKER